MNTNKLMKTGLLVMTAGSLLLAGCVYHERTVYSPPPGPAPAPGAEVEVNGPPPPPPESDVTIGVAPAPGFVWIGGFWGWGPHGWVWTHGYWGRPPHRGMRWYGPHYEFRGGRHVWVRGGWR
jgi:hypothetical protein